MSETTWTLLKSFAPLLLVIGFLVALGFLKRKVGKPLPPASHCQACGEASPGLRAPNSVNQALWGGWTCAGCGANLNAQGEPIGGPSRPPSTPLRGPFSRLLQRRPGLTLGLFWGLVMWGVMSVAPMVQAALHGAGFPVGKAVVSFLLWVVLGGAVFGAGMRTILVRKPKA